MTQDQGLRFEEIIKLAREAGGFRGELPKGDAWMFFEDAYIERFAALVAAHEREKQAKDKQCKHCEDTAACLDAGICLSKYDSTVRIESAVIAAKAEEREACAKVCDDLSAHYWEKDFPVESINCEECAAAIRARGE